MIETLARLDYERKMEKTLHEWISVSCFFSTDIIKVETYLKFAQNN